MRVSEDNEIKISLCSDFIIEKNLYCDLRKVILCTSGLGVVILSFDRFFHKY